jgi:hypothetical protein
MPGSERSKHAIQFPICSKAEDVGAEITRRLPGIPDPIRRVIERHQPAAQSASGQALGLLSRLNNLDKHREVRTVVAQGSGSFEFRVLESTHAEIIRVEPVATSDQILILKPGTPLAYVYFRRTSTDPAHHTHLKVQMGGRQSPAFDTGHFVEDTFDDVVAAISQVFDEIAAVLWSTENYSR